VSQRPGEDLRGSSATQKLDGDGCVRRQRNFSGCRVWHPLILDVRNGLAIDDDADLIAPVAIPGEEDIIARFFRGERASANRGGPSSVVSRRVAQLLGCRGTGGRPCVAGAKLNLIVDWVEVCERSI